MENNSIWHIYIWSRDGYHWTWEMKRVKFEAAEDGENNNNFSETVMICSVTRRVDEINNNEKKKKKRITWTLWEGRCPCRKNVPPSLQLRVKDSRPILSLLSTKKKEKGGQKKKTERNDTNVIQSTDHHYSGCTELKWLLLLLLLLLLSADWLPGLGFVSVWRYCRGDLTFVVSWWEKKKTLEFIALYTQNSSPFKWRHFRYPLGGH